MSGRRTIPGEKGPHDIIGRNHVFDRTIRGQVTATNQDNGYVVLTYAEIPSGGKFATVAPLWLSIPNPEIGGPAWGRFMPQEGDIVKVSFDFDDYPFIVGYDVAAGKKGVADWRAGWPQLNDLYAEAVADGPSSPNPSMATFIPLQPGEYDFMSSGGAYVYGNNLGKLFLAGGAVMLSLIKDDMRADINAQLLSTTSETSTMNFGQVRRTNSSTQLDTVVSADSAGAFKEFSTILKTNTAPGSALDLARLQLGNVVTDSGSIDNSPISGQPSRYSYRTYDSTGSEIFHEAIDTGANWDIKGTITSQVNFNFSTASWNTTFQSTTHNDTDVTYNTSATFNINSPSINLGAGAANPLILSNTFLPALTATLSGIVSILGTAGAALDAAGADVPFSGAFSGAAGNIAAAGAALDGAAAVLTAYTALLATFISEVSRTA